MYGMGLSLFIVVFSFPKKVIILTPNDVGVCSYFLNVKSYLKPSL